MNSPGGEDPLEHARSFGPVLEKLAVEIEKDRRLPEALVQDMVDAGFFHLLVPRDYGGAEVAPVVFLEVLEELARHDASTAWCLGQTGVCGMASAYLAPEPAAEIWGERRGILVWGVVSTVKAVETPGGYRVSGSWPFASGGHHATWLGGHCIVADANGEPRTSPTGTTIPRTVLFPASEVTWTDIWDVVGLRGTGSDLYAVEDAFVPTEFTIGLNEPAERVIDRPLYRLRTVHMYACGFACIALGIARAMLDSYVDLANEKTPRGLQSTMRDNAVVQSDVAELEARLRAARAYLYETMAVAWRAAQDGELSVQQRMMIRLAATHCIGEAHKVASGAYRAAGTTAIFASNPFERRFRDINSISQHAQGRRTHFETVGKFMLGVETELLFL